MRGENYLDKKCPNCGQDMPEEASFCLECFSPLNISPIEATEKNNKNSKAIILIIIFVLIFSIVVTSIFIKSNKENNITVLNTTATGKVTKTTTSQQTTKLTTKPTTQITTKKSTTESTTPTETTTKKPTTSTTVSTTKSTTKKLTATTAPAEVVIDGSTLTNYPSSRKNTSYTIPYSVTKISNNAFNNNKYLKTLKFSKREKLDCNFQNLFASLPNLETVYVYPGTDADLEGLQYFDGEIVYYD